MIKIFYFFFIMLISLANPGLCQVSHRELIIQVPGITHERGFPEIKNELLSIEGVTVIAFCKQQQLILVKVNALKLENDLILFEKIRNLHYKFYVKQDASLLQAMTTCTKRELSLKNELPLE